MRRSLRTLGGHGPAAAAAASAWRQAGLHARERSTPRTCSIASKRAAATKRTATLWSPGLFPRRSGRDHSRHAGRLDRSLGDDSGAARRGKRSQPNSNGAALICCGKPLGGADRAVRGELVLAADQFIITPAGRAWKMPARAQAAGDEVRTVIAGYHWFTDWGRDTMISLEGLTLTTGRHARSRLHPAHVRPLHPRRPDSEPVSRRREARGSITRPTPRSGSSTPSTATCEHHGRSRDAASCCCRSCSTSSSITCAARASAFGVDPDDGLLRQGQEGYQLTWMDAKVGDWVVTPRRGKAVEINALWYNALRLLERWLREEGKHEAAASPWQTCRTGARLVQRALLERRDAAISIDVVDGETGRRSGLPAQSGLRDLAATTRCSIEQRWEPVLDVVRADNC